MEKRHSKRFHLALPVEITHSEGKRMSRAAQTRDIGSGGLLLSTSREVREGAMMEYLTTLVHAAPPVRMRCRGVVLRVRRVAPDGDRAFEVAVTIDRYEFVRCAPLQPIAEAGSELHLS